MKELRKTIPGQSIIKNECTIGVSYSRHIILILIAIEDYVYLLSVMTFYVKEKYMYW